MPSFCLIMLVFFSPLKDIRNTLSSGNQPLVGKDRNVATQPVTYKGWLLSMPIVTFGCGLCHLVIECV